MYFFYLPLIYNIYIYIYIQKLQKKNNKATKQETNDDHERKGPGLLDGRKRLNRKVCIETHPKDNLPRDCRMRTQIYVYSYICMCVFSIEILPLNNFHTNTVHVNASSAVHSRYVCTYRHWDTNHYDYYRLLRRIGRKHMQNTDYVDAVRQKKNGKTE